MSEKKKKEFGLAAQLTQPRSTAEGKEAEPLSAARDSRVRQATVAVEEPVLLPTPQYISAELQRTAKPERFEEKKRPGAPPRIGGYVRRTITLDPALSDYIDTAWRTHRNSNGEFVKGVSGFVESLIAEHRRRTLTRA